MRLSLPGPVKRSRATLESDPPRDNRTGWRRMSTRGSRFPLPHPTATTINIQSFPPCLINSGGVGAEPPRTVAERQCILPGDSSLFCEGKIPFHAEPGQTLSRYAVLLIDELGYLTLKPEQVNAFFRLMDERYGKTSTLITTNLEYSDWYSLFQRKSLVDALLNRLQHHCVTIRVGGPSLRVPEEQQPDLPTSHPVL